MMILSCPFCQEEGVIYDDSFLGEKWFYVKCLNCGAHGPTSLDAEGAIDKWNERDWNRKSD